ncbi:MAG: hypothetical protein ACK4GK_12535 [Ferrovibrio sp.]
MDIPQILTSVSTAIDIAKGLREATNVVSEAESKFKLAELTSKLADVKIALADMQEELHTKDKEIARLREAFAIRETLIDKNNQKYVPDKDGNPVGYPVCPRCLTVDGRIIQMQQNGRSMMVASCPECQRTYHGVSEYLPRD